MKKDNIYTLAIGQSVQIRGGFLARQYLIYAGQVSDKVYSLAVQWTRGHNSAAYNIYIPVEQKEVSVLLSRVVVHNVSPSEISLSFHDE